MEYLPKALIKSAGARLMSQSKPHTMTRERAQNTAKARWDRPKWLKWAKSLGIPGTEKMTNMQLEQAIDKVFE
jgi:hypothetical protein